MTQAVKNFAFNTILPILITVVVSMGGFWLVEGRHYMTRDEIHVYVEDEIKSSSQTNPYLLDRQMLVETMNDVKTVKRDMNQLFINIAILTEQVKKEK